MKIILSTSHLCWIEATLLYFTIGTTYDVEIGDLLGAMLGTLLGASLRNNEDTFERIQVVSLLGIEVDVGLPGWRDESELIVRDEQKVGSDKSSTGLDNSVGDETGLEDGSKLVRLGKWWYKTTWLW